jgi:ketosteroid isomerase-like protein
MKRAEKPEDLHTLFAEALNARDVEALAALYSSDACLSPRKQDAAQGLSAIRKLLASYCEMKATMEICTRKQITVGDTALIMSDWHMTGTAADGRAIDARGTSVEVARRDTDGAWRYLIDLPSGIES